MIRAFQAEKEARHRADVTAAQGYPFTKRALKGGSARCWLRET